MANDMPTEDEDVTAPMLDPNWEEQRNLHEMRSFRMTAVDFAIKTEQISTIGAGDTSEAIRRRILNNADEYVRYVMDGGLPN